MEKEFCYLKEDILLQNVTNCTEFKFQTVKWEITTF